MEIRSWKQQTVHLWSYNWTKLAFYPQTPEIKSLSRDVLKFTCRYNFIPSNSRNFNCGRGRGKGRKRRKWRNWIGKRGVDGDETVVFFHKNVLVQSQTSNSSDTKVLYVESLFRVQESCGSGEMVAPSGESTAKHINQSTLPGVSSPAGSASSLSDTPASVPGKKQSFYLLNRYVVAYRDKFRLIFHWTPGA